MALTKSEVSALYVAIFNRASEGEGNTYWQTAGTSAEVADIMLETAPAKAYFGASLDSDQAFVEHIYLNTLGKTVAEDADGIAFWVGELATQSRGEVIARLIESAQDPANAGPAQDMFKNMVAVSDYAADTLENAPENLDDLRFDKALEGLTVAQAKAVVDALANAVAPSELAEALTALDGANKAIDAFLDDAPALKAGAVDAAAGEASSTDVTAYYAAVAADVVTATGVTGFATLSVANQNAVISNEKSALQTEIDIATDAAVDGMPALLGAVASREEQLVARQKAEIAANSNVAVEFAAFAVANGLGSATSADVVFMTAAEYDATGDYTSKYLVIGNKIYTGEAAVALDKIAVVADVARAAEFKAALDQQVAAKTAVASATSALKTAVTNVYLAENDAYSLVAGEIDNVVDTTKVAPASFVDFAQTVKFYKTKADADAAVPVVTSGGAATEAADLAVALAELKKFSDLAAKFEQARDLNAELLLLEKAADNAEKAITNAADDKDLPGLDVELKAFDALTGDDAGLGDDVFLFAADAGATVKIANFGADGVDRIFFADTFKLVDLGNKAITERVGEVDELEIFYKEVGGDLQLYVEAEAFAGNAVNTADITTIVLTGVTADEFSFADGFISAGSVA